MKCKIFSGEWYKAQDAFNAWAKGKSLTRDVLIHTISLAPTVERAYDKIAIVVYHPDDPSWDKTPERIAKIKSYTVEETAEERALKVTA
jgi:2-C-methyl-D-erythritol 4-phosphate cytidylyltransferase